MPTSSIAQIITDASNIADEKERISFLQSNDNTTLRQILRLGLDPEVEWDLPEGAPSYKKCSYIDIEGRLYQEMRTLYLYLKGGNPALNKVKREFLFIGLLESLDPRDAELLIAVKDKKLPKTISKKVVSKAFPELFNE